ncbi:MAG: class I adenylate-forming enzyme family protein [Candidatus Krumholzibacteriota bacterium]
MLVQEFLERNAEKTPGREALVAGTERLTYQDLEIRSNSLARTLIEHGVEYGDRVAVMMDNSAGCVTAIWAALKAGGIFLVINPTTKEHKTEYILNDCGATALITHSSRWKSASGAASGAPSLRCVVLAGKEAAAPEGFSAEIISWDEALKSPESRPGIRTIDIDLASLVYTSGTTGNPKGVMMTHRNMISASTSITTYLENVESDIILNALPLSFDYGLYQVIMAAQFGGKLVLEKSFTYPYAVINKLKEERVTGFPVVPTMLTILLRLKGIQNENLEHLRYITNTAAALPVSHIRKFREYFPEVTVYSMYGLTECKRVSYLPPEMIDQKPASVGKGMPNEQVYLVDEDGNIIDQPDTPGELVVRGGNVSKGYWGKPEETARILKEGRYPWEKVLYTGDIFKMDRDGYLYFISRKDDIIKSRGEKVSPREIENVLYMIEDVMEAAVTGEPDELLGEAIKVYLRLADGSKLTEKDILRHCAANLEDFMVPQVVEIRDSLPRTASGKITKKSIQPISKKGRK